MKVTDLKSNQYMFGGKGDVWSNTAHVSEGGSSTTLCGKPMLSTNWCRINEVEEIGCPKCLEILKNRSNE